MMAYYDRKGKVLIGQNNNMEYLSAGECATVSYNYEMIFKEYFSDTFFNCRLNPTLFDIFKDIHNDHFIKLFEIYCDMDLLEFIRFKIGVRKFVVDAYTAAYYSDDSVNVLYESIDYILDNSYESDKLFDIFTDNMIVTEDVKRKNAILGHSGIIIIDPDLFYISSLPKQDIAVANKRELLTLIRSICISGMANIENHDDIFRKIVLDLVDIDIDYKTDIAYALSKKLKSVKRPIDYLIK